MAGTTNEEEGDKGEDDEDEDETGLETRQMCLEPVCHVKKGPNDVFHVIWVICTCFFIFIFHVFSILTNTLRFYLCFEGIGVGRDRKRA